MADLKLSSLPSATSVNATDSIFLNNEGKTKTSPVSYLPTGANNGEYTINFEDILKESIASGRYENAGYSEWKKSCAYMKYAITLATQRVHTHGGGTILFEKLYIVDGGTAGWEIDNVNNVTFRGVGEAGFIKPPTTPQYSGTSTGKQRFGFIRHCNNLRFINMQFIGRQTDMPKLYTADYGVEIHSGDGIYFEGCTFANMNDAALVVGNETVSETDGLDCTKNVYVNKCKFLNTWQTSTTQNGVYNYWFTNNYVAGGATKFAQRLPNGDNIHVLNNVYKVHKNFIGNPLEFCNYNNVWIENNVVIGSENAAVAMSLYYNTHADTNYYQTHNCISIKGNKIYGCKTGIWFNHGVANYPAGRIVIEDNTLKGNISSKAISISGYFDIVKIKNNYIDSIKGIGICIGTNSASAIVDKLYIENNIIKNTTKAPVIFNQYINYLKFNNNHIENNINYPLIKSGDGEASGIFKILEFRNNYLKNSYSGQHIFQTQTGSYGFAMIYDNYIVGSGAGFYGFGAKTVMLAGNYINTANASVHFPSGSSATIYTIDNVLSKNITLNGATQVAK